MVKASHPAIQEPGQGHRHPRGRHGGYHGRPPAQRVEGGAPEEPADTGGLDDRHQHHPGADHGGQCGRAGPAGNQRLAQLGADEGGQPDRAGPGWGPGGPSHQPGARGPRRRARRPPHDRLVEG